MKMKKVLSGLLLLSTGLLALNASAQLYKSVGPDGKVTYSDVPPPPSIKRVEVKSITGGDSPVNNFPADLAGPASKNPVAFYSTAGCAPCDEARSMLKSNGIPFAEKTVKTNEDVARLKQVSGGALLPAMTVGSKKISGYQSADWRTSLTDAGYPTTNRLPKDYRYPAPEAAAPPPPPPAKAKDTANDASKPAPAQQNGEATFRF
ncbi:glutaredoxin family protein [Undibacterium sp. TJN25]|uniref:glutaredoxin family protein n=1 Tax=Undibacterium sp. TJN25 TaxID=3413056 RepID=UPI003BF07DB5